MKIIVENEMWKRVLTEAEIMESDFEDLSGNFLEEVIDLEEVIEIAPAGEDVTNEILVIAENKNELELWEYFMDCMASSDVFAEWWMENASDYEKEVGGQYCDAATLRSDYIKCVLKQDLVGENLKDKFITQL